MGFLQWFPIGDKAFVEDTIQDLHTLRARYLRTGLSWADWEDESRQNPSGMTGREWHIWLYSLLAGEGLDILPNLLYTPLDKAMPDEQGVRRTSHPPTHPEDYASFVKEAIDELGNTFEHVELLNEPHLKQEWNRDLDPDFAIFTQMVREGGKAARERDKKVVLGGTVVHHPDWLLARVGQGILDYIDIVGLHAFPYFQWGAKHSDKSVVEYTLLYKKALHEAGFEGQFWLTETGFPTMFDPNANEERQVEVFLSLMDQDVIERVYWWSVVDLHPETPSYTESQIGFREDVFYHFGIKTYDGRPKLLYRKIAAGEISLP